MIIARGLGYLVAVASLTLTLTLTLTLRDTLAQSAEPYTPTVGQDGKDVIWVPTPQELVDRMLGMAQVGPKDYLVDLGSGDGRTVITAAKLGAKAHGIEYNEKMVELSRRNAEKEGVAEKATFEKADIFQSDFSQATVITLFLLEDLNLRLRPTLLALKPGTRIVSNTFDMSKWKYDAVVELGSGCTQFCKAYLWIIPAQVAGSWQLVHDSETGNERPLTLVLNQSFQVISGIAKPAKGRPANLTSTRVRADEIGFNIGAATYQGKLAGESMTGSYRLGGRVGMWTATRVNPARSPAGKRP